MSSATEPTPINNSVAVPPQRTVAEVMDSTDEIELAMRREMTAVHTTIVEMHQLEKQTEDDSARAAFQQYMKDAVPRYIKQQQAATGVKAANAVIDEHMNGLKSL